MDISDEIRKMFGELNKDLDALRSEVLVLVEENKALRSEAAVSDLDGFVEWFDGNPYWKALGGPHDDRRTVGYYDYSGVLAVAVERWRVGIEGDGDGIWKPE